MSRRQLAVAGFDSDAIDWRISKGLWQAVGLAVVLRPGQLNLLESQWAAVLSAPSAAALAGGTAAKCHGLKGFDSRLTHVLVPAEARPVAIPNVQWHRSTRFGLPDIVNGYGPGMVCASRAVVDAAAWTKNARLACATMVSAVQQRVTNVAALKIELEAAGRIEHGHVLRAIIGDIEGGADSLAEIDLGKLAQMAGLPPPIRQSFRLDSDGRRRYLDVDFGTFSVEVDGGFHLRALNAWDDARRQNALVIGGDRILRFPSMAIRLDPAGVVAQLRLAKARFGVSH